MTKSIASRLLNLLLVVVLTPALPARAAQTFPRPFEASYRVAFNGKEAGVMTRTLRRDGQRFQFDSEIRATKGLYALLRVRINESSRWHLQGSDAITEEFHALQTGLKKKESRAVFDWSRGVVAVDHKKQHSEIPATPGMTDKLLYQLLLMRDLAGSVRPIRYTVVDGNKVRDYAIEILGNEKISTPLGELDAVKVRYRKPGSERSTTLWCARSLGYLPVKLDHREDENERTEAMIQSIRWQ